MKKCLMPKSNFQAPNKFFTFSGYTLIEVLVAISILSLLFLAGMASYREFSRRQALVSVVRQVKADLRLTQQYAIASKKPAGCTVLDGYYFRVVPSDRYRISYYCDPTATLEKEVVLPSGITISGLAPNLTPSNTIWFKTLGDGTNIPTVPGSTVITITQTTTSESLTVTVTSGGEIR